MYESCTRCKVSIKPYIYVTGKFVFVRCPVCMGVIRQEKRLIQSKLTDFDGG
jgi:hypothetical protein